MSNLRMKKVLHHLRRAALRAPLGLTDGELLEDFLRQRNDPSFESLIERHGPMVWGVCQRFLHNHHDVEDAFQATFLVFLRKAEAIFPRDMVGNWLYGVACQTAQNARALAARRRERYQEARDVAAPAAKPPAEAGEERLLLDQELGRLPANYRSVIVLCELEGQTRKEAARQLKVPEGTIAGWLARAKTLLAKRLTQRGLAVSVGAVAVLLAQSTARCAAPRTLMDATIKAAKLFAAGQNAAGIASPAAIALSEGVIRIMFASKFKTLSVLLLAPLFGAFLIAGAAQTSVPATGPRAEPVAAQTPAPAAGDKKQVDPTSPAEKPKQADPPLVPPVAEGAVFDPLTGRLKSIGVMGSYPPAPPTVVQAPVAGYSLVNRLGAQLAQPGQALVHQLDLPAEQGLVLHSILLESAAADAGMKNYDILLELGGKKVPHHPHEFMKVLNEFKTGVALDAVVVRKGKKQTIKGVTLPKVAAVPQGYYYEPHTIYGNPYYRPAPDFVPVPPPAAPAPKAPPKTPPAAPEEIKLPEPTKPAPGAPNPAPGAGSFREEAKPGPGGVLQEVTPPPGGVFQEAAPGSGSGILNPPPTDSVLPVPKQ